MTFSFGFFNSLDGDRKYDAADFAGVFDTFAEDGVVRNFGTNFAVKAAGGLNLLVGTGRAWFRKTWSYNDTDLAITAAAASASGARLDAVILEVDTSTAVRRNRIFYAQGTATAYPALASTDTLKQYPLAYIPRTVNNNTILQAGITSQVGTTLTPWATSRLLDRTWEPAVMHRNVFRGKMIGTAVTAAQQAAIANQTWDDLYVGDYWEIGGRKYRIVDFNYWLGTGSPENVTPHVVVMPDSNIGSCQWNSAGNTNTGYVGTTLDKYLSSTAYANIINPAFGARVLEIRTTYVNATNGAGVASGDAWYSTKAQTPTAIQMYGNTWSPAWRTESTTQFALFQIAPQFIKSSDKDATWLRDTSSGSLAALVHRALYPTSASSSVADTAGVRPTFALY